MQIVEFLMKLSQQHLATSADKASGQIPPELPSQEYSTSPLAPGGLPCPKCRCKEIIPPPLKEEKSRSHQAGGTNVHLSRQGTDPTCPQLADTEYNFE